MDNIKQIPTRQPRPKPSQEEVAARGAKAAATKAWNREVKQAYAAADKRASKENRGRQRTIEKLGNMTVANGCTEAEAASAHDALARVSAKPDVTAMDKVAPQYQPPPLPDSIEEWDKMRTGRRR
jgi:hypothetical protein